MPTSHTFGRPVLFSIIVFGDSRYIFWKDDPGLLGLGKYVDIGWQSVRVVQCSYANELDYRSSASVVAPEGYSARRAASNRLSQAAIGGRVNQLWLDTKIRDPVRFYHCVQGERGTRFALTPSAVAAMDEQRSAFHSVAH